MKVLKIISPDAHGKSVQILDGEGNDIAKHCRRVEITLDCQALTVARLEVFADVEIEAFLEGVTILERKCLHCEDLVETTVFGVAARTYTQGGERLI